MLIILYRNLNQAPTKKIPICRKNQSKKEKKIDVFTENGRNDRLVNKKRSAEKIIIRETIPIISPLSGHILRP